MPGSYIRGAYAVAATSLIDALKAVGVAAHVGYASRKRDRTLIVHVIKGDPAEVPPEWRGFVVRVERPAPTGRPDPA